MEITDDTLDLIKHFEGLRLSAYLCPAGVPTVGYGHTGPDVRLGLTITEGMASAFLERDAEDAMAGVMRLVTVDLTPPQAGALCSFSFNLGLSALGKSTLLKRVNAGDGVGAANEFLKWDHDGKVEVDGLTQRRWCERAMFMGGNWREV